MSDKRWQKDTVSQAGARSVPRDTHISPETPLAMNICSTITRSYVLLKVTKPVWVRLLPLQPPTQTQLIKLNINLHVTTKYLCKQPFIDLEQDYHSCRWLWDSSKVSRRNMPRAQGLALRLGFLGFSDGRRPRIWRAGRSGWNSRLWSLCHFNPLSFYKHVRLKLSVELIDSKRIIGEKKRTDVSGYAFLNFGIVA